MKRRRENSAAEHVPLWELEDGLVVDTAGRYAAVYQLTGLDSEYAPTDVLKQAAMHLQNGMRNDLPERTALQFVGEGHGDYGDVFDAFQAVPPPAHPVLAMQRTRRLAFLKNQPLRRHRLWLTVSDSAQGGRAFPALSRDQHQALRKAAEARGAAVAAWLENAGVSVRPVSEVELEAGFFRMLNPGRAGGAFGPAIASPQDTDLRWMSRRERLVQSPLAWTRDIATLNGVFHRVLMGQGLPDATRFTMMEAFLHVPIPIRWTVHLQITSRKRLEAMLDRLRRFLNVDAHRGGHVHDPARLGRLEEAHRLAETLAETQQRLVKVGMQVVVWAECEAQLKQRVADVHQHLRRYGLGFVEETGRHLPELMKSLPGLGGGFDRFKLVTSHNAVDLLPIFQGRSGDRRPVLLVQTASEALYSFDPLEPARDNYNALVLGASGAGKSVLMNMLITTAMLTHVSKGKVIVVDFAGETKSSYLMAARLFGGRFIPIVSETPVALNPFPPPEVACQNGALKGSVLSVLTVLTDLLVANKGQDREAQLYRTLLQRALQEVYEGRTTAPTFADVAQVLMTYRGRSDVDRDRLSILLELLEGFLRSPEARFFTGTGGPDVEGAPLVIFDMHGLDGLPSHVAEALTFLVCHIVKGVAFETEGPSYVVLDEVAQLLRRAEMVQLVDELYSTARKHGTSVWTVTQNYASYVKSAVAETIKLNSTAQFFLSHASAADVRARVVQDFAMTDREAHLFEGLETRKGEYSEVLLRTETWDPVKRHKAPQTTKLKVTLSPFDYELATSDAADRARQRKWQDLNPTAPLVAVMTALADHRAHKRGRAS